MFRLSVAAAAAFFAINASAQVVSTCDPTWGNVTCSDDAALGTTFNYSFNASMTEMDSRYFNVSAGASLIEFTDNGAELNIRKQGDSVTIETNFYILEGTVEIMMQAAAGQGIISTINLLSDDLDEIDWEIMGGNSSYVSNNWYGMGNTSQHNGEYPALKGAMDTFHNYTIDWTQERLQWIADGQVVRTLNSADPGLYPQTPSFIKFGIWAGGDPSLPNGTIEWAGGLTDFSKAPFTMTVKSIKIVDNKSNVTSYTYGDTTGSYSSIKANAGESKVFKALHKLTAAQEAARKWSGLSQTGKIAIAASIGGAVLLSIIIYSFVCVTQRKKGRLEKEMHDREWEAQQNELLEYKSQMQKGGFAISNLSSQEVRY